MIERTHVDDIHWTSETVWGGVLRHRVCFEIVGPPDMFDLGQTVLFDDHEWTVKEVRSKALTYGGTMCRWVVTAVRTLR